MSPKNIREMIQHQKQNKENDYWPKTEENIHDQKIKEMIFYTLFF